MTDPDTDMRKTALKLAADIDKFFGNNATPRDIVDVAKIFYAFLKGENK